MRRHGQAQLLRAQRIQRAANALVEIDLQHFIDGTSRGHAEARRELEAALEDYMRSFGRVRAVAS